MQSRWTRLNIGWQSIIPFHCPIQEVEKRLKNHMVARFVGVVEFGCVQSNGSPWRVSYTLETHDKKKKKKRGWDQQVMTVFKKNCRCWTNFRKTHVFSVFAWKIDVKWKLLAERRIDRWPLEGTGVHILLIGKMPKGVCQQFSRRNNSCQYWCCMFSFFLKEAVTHVSRQT